MAITVFKPLDNFSHMSENLESETGAPFINRMADWLESSGFPHSVENVTVPSTGEIHFMNHIHYYQYDKLIGWNYTFDTTRHAILFKLVWT